MSAREEPEEPVEKKSKTARRSSLDAFDWKTHCMFCGKACIKDEKHPERDDFHLAEYKEYKDVVLQQCIEIDDDEARIVEHRVRSCSDFIAAEARYHGSCRGSFNLKVKTKSSSTKKGRPVKETDGFDALCEWIETEGELHTLEDLRNQLICITGSKDVYTTTSIKRKLEKKYGTDISFNEVSGRCNVVCLSNIAKHIINDLWYENRNRDVESEAERIVKTAAKLILSEIRSQYFDCDNYPSKEDIQDDKKNLN